MMYNPMSGNKSGKKVMRKAKSMLEREGVNVTVVALERKG